MASLESFGLLWSAFKNVNCGPFEIGGNLYAFAVTAALRIVAYKSTDAGVNWIEIDSANAPTAFSQFLDVRPVGSTLYVLYAPSGGGGVLAVRKFSSDAWQALESGMTTSPPSGTDLHFTILTIVAMLAVRADGNYVVLHQGATEMVMGAQYRRTVYSRFVSGAWTTNVDVGGTGDEVHRDCRAILKGDPTNNFVHFFYTKNSTSLFCRTLDGTSLGSEVTVVSAGISGINNYPVGLPVYNGSQLVVPYFVLGTNTLNVSRSNDHASATSWTVDTTIVNDISNAPEFETANLAALANNSGTIYAVWPERISDDLFLDNDGGAANGWGTDVEIVDAVTVQGVSANHCPSNNIIGVLYSNSGTVTFFAYALSAPFSEYSILGRPYGNIGARQMHQIGVL